TAREPAEAEGGVPPPGGGGGHEAGAGLPGPCADPGRDPEGAPDALPERNALASGAGPDHEGGGGMSESVTLDLAYPRGLWSDWLRRPRPPRRPSTPKPRTQHRIPWRGKRMCIRRPLKLLIRVSASENCGFCPACLAQEVLGEQ